MIAFPNAKINIGLHILRKRQDGFHDIDSVFYPVKELYDALEIIPSDEFSFTSSGITIPDDGENICVKAYQLVKEKYNIPPVEIHLHKAIPIGAGLGGGSSDAVSTVRLLDQIFDLNIQETEMIAFASKLGSDCFFFIQNKPMRVTGRGERMDILNADPLEDYAIEIKFPNIHIDTKWAYGQITPSEDRISISQLIKYPIQRWKKNITNDFEEPIFQKFPEIKSKKMKLYESGAVYASLSGSGSALFGLFTKK